MSDSMMYSHYGRGNDDEQDRNEGWSRSVKDTHISRP